MQTVQLREAHDATLSTRSSRRCPDGIKNWPRGATKDAAGVYCPVESFAELRTLRTTS